MLDNGYHSNDSLVLLKKVEVRSYCSEPDRGRRNWIGKPEEKAAVYQNRRRIRGERGKAAAASPWGTGGTQVSLTCTKPEACEERTFDFTTTL